MQYLSSLERARRLVPNSAARLAFEKGLADADERKVIIEKLENERLIKEKAYNIAQEEAELARLHKELARLQKELTENMLLANDWSILEHKEMEIRSMKAQIRTATRNLRMSKGIAPSAEEHAQEEKEKEAEKHFSKVSRLTAMPQYVREDIYERSQFEDDLVAFWTEQSAICERLLVVRAKIENERKAKA